MNHLLPRSLLAACCALALAACAEIKYEHVPYDNPPPWGTAAPGPSCRTIGGQLASGAVCVALVRARDWYADTGLTVHPGEAYCVQVPPGQQWFDASSINSPPRGEEGSALVNLFASLKRYPKAGWFSLIVAVVDPSPANSERRPVSAVLDSDRQVEAASLEELRRCGADGNLFRPAAQGRMVFYANDAAVEGPDPEKFYRNNSGQIWVSIVRAPAPAAR
jgi:hypothetical protein